MTFGQRIKKLRKEADYTQEQLGEMLGVSTQAVSRWETDAAMPDICLLAPIANLFNVTTDYLLDVDIQRKNDRINDILKKAADATNCCKNERWNDAVEIIRDGLRLYPDSWEMKSRLALYLQFYRGDEATKKSCYEEANKLCEDIVAGCPDRRLQYEAIQQIARMAGKLDNRSRALELAETMPLVHQCREFLMMGNLKKEAAIPHGKQLIHTLSIHMEGLIYGYAMVLDTPEEVGALYTKAAAIQDILYENDDFIKSRILGDSMVEWAEQFARVGDFDTAFRLLNEDLDRIMDIEGRKLSTFSMLSPEAYTRQVEAADIAERDGVQRFHVEDYVCFLDKYFPEVFKKDERYAMLIARYEAYLKGNRG